MELKTGFIVAENSVEVERDRLLPKLSRYKIKREQLENDDIEEGCRNEGFVRKSSKCEEKKWLKFKQKKTFKENLTQIYTWLCEMEKKLFVPTLGTVLLKLSLLLT